MEGEGWGKKERKKERQKKEKKGKRKESYILTDRMSIINSHYAIIVEYKNEKE